MCTVGFRCIWRKIEAVAQDEGNGAEWFVAYAPLEATRRMSSKPTSST